jgi:hypothetical protein
MDIGELQRVLQIEPLVVPVPEVLPIPAPNEAPVAEPADTDQRA